jgi:hypothetical protein
MRLLSRPRLCGHASCAPRTPRSTSAWLQASTALLALLASWGQHAHTSKCQHVRIESPRCSTAAAPVLPPNDVERQGLSRKCFHQHRYYVKHAEHITPVAAIQHATAVWKRAMTGRPNRAPWSPPPSRMQRAIHWPGSAAVPPPPGTAGGKRGCLPLLLLLMMLLGRLQRGG